MTWINDYIRCFIWDVITNPCPDLSVIQLDRLRPMFFLNIPVPGSVFTVGSLNADILRYNADNLSITLKLWGKLDENVSSVNTFPSHSPISLHFTRQNIAYRVTTVSMLATAPMLSTYIVLSRGNGCHRRATTLILWGQRQFWGNFRFQLG